MIIMNYKPFSGSHFGQVYDFYCRDWISKVIQNGRFEAKRRSTFVRL